MFAAWAGCVHSQHVRPQHMELRGRMGLAHYVAVWEMCFFLKLLRTRLYPEAQADCGGGLSLLSELWDWEQDWRTGQMNQSPSLPVAVVLVGALQETSVSG